MTLAMKHPFVNPHVDGADGTLTQPSAWNAGHNPWLSKTNKSGGTVNQYDAVVPDTGNNDAFATTTTVGDPRPVLVVQDATIANNAAGNVQSHFDTTVNVQGNVTRGNWLRFSATAGRLEDTAVASTSFAPEGACAIATSAYGGGAAGTVTAFVGVCVTGRPATTWGANLNDGSTRVFATPYHNTSGRTRNVTIAVSGIIASILESTFVTDSFTPPTTERANCSNLANALPGNVHTHTYSIRIPNGWYYQLNRNGTNATLREWYEWDE